MCDKAREMAYRLTERAIHRMNNPDDGNSITLDEVDREDTAALCRLALAAQTVRSWAHPRWCGAIRELPCECGLGKLLESLEDIYRLDILQRPR